MRFRQWGLSGRTKGGRSCGTQGPALSVGECLSVFQWSSKGLCPSSCKIGRQGASKIPYYCESTQNCSIYSEGANQALAQPVSNGGRDWKQHVFHTFIERERSTGAVHVYACFMYCIVTIIVNKWMELLLVMKEINKIWIKMATPILHPPRLHFILNWLLYWSVKEDVIVKTLWKTIF